MEGILIGLKKMHRHLFVGIDWRTERVFTQTLHRAGELGLTVHKLPAGFDVDDGATLKRLAKELVTDQASTIAPNTQRFLKDIVAREGRNRIWPVG